MAGPTDGSFPWPTGGNGYPTNSGGIGSGSTDWTKYLPLIMQGASMGLGLLGARSASNQMNKANQLSQQNADRLYQLGQQEQARRNAIIQSMLQPIANNMRMNPQALQGISQAMGTNPTVSAGQSPYTSALTDATPKGPNPQNGAMDNYMNMMGPNAYQDSYRLPVPGGAL